MTTEPTPQELAKDAINLLIGATEAGRWSAATFAAQDGIIAAFVDAAALTAALDANEEMHEAIRNWSNAHAAVTWIDDDVDSADDALHDIATTPPTGVSLRAELAEARAEIKSFKKVLAVEAPCTCWMFHRCKRCKALGRIGNKSVATALADAATPETEQAP